MLRTINQSFAVLKGRSLHTAGIPLGRNVGRNRYGARVARRIEPSFRRKPESPE
jgi:hypothetical protein